MKNIRSLLLPAILMILAGCGKQEPREVSIIPKPYSIIRDQGTVRITKSWTLSVDDMETFSANAHFLGERFKKAAGIELPVSTSATSKSIKLHIDPKLTDSLGVEGYLLKTAPNSIEITGTAQAGIFYGIQTFFQLLPPEIYSDSLVSGVKWTVPRVVINDKPRFVWRGFLLDVSRHFFPASYIFEVMDHMAMHKMNRLQLHLTDDQGWRLEIKKYPKLTEVGAWRVNREDRHWNSREPQKPGEKADYGGFYTQEEIREMVRYGNTLNITIVPEIEMPAHATGCLAAYPELTCTGKPLAVLPGGIWPCSNIFCAGKDETFAFLEDVLSEVIDLFPSKYIHIGGDEADKTEWIKCPACQKRIRQEGLKNEKELQSYFIRRIEKFINSRGRNLLGWDEILEGGLAENATVMSWRGTQGGIEAARAGHHVVMTPTSHCYLDYYQGKPEYEPLAIGGYLPLEKVYSFEPVPSELSLKESGMILGAQGNLWTEYVSEPSHADYMAFPRLTALSEVCWTHAGQRSYDDFTKRLTEQFKRFEAMGMNYSKSFSNVEVQSR